MTRAKLHYRKHLTAPTGHAGNRPLKRAASAVVLLTLSLTAATLVTANNLATQGGTSQLLDRQIAELQAENTQLAAENAALTAMTRVYTEAMAQGFAAPKKLENLTQPAPVALRNP